MARRVPLVPEGAATISIQASRTSAHWQLSFKNPGQMTPEENDLKFTPYEKPAAPRADGAHVGLAAALALAHANHAEITLENCEDNQVEAILTWPLVQASEKTHDGQ